jgi:hypothetical protein
MQEAVKLVSGKTVAELIDFTTKRGRIPVKRGNGKFQNFGIADLRYYLKHGYLKSVPGRDAPEEHSVPSAVGHVRRMMVGFDTQTVRQVADAHSIDDTYGHWVSMPTREDGAAAAKNKRVWATTHAEPGQHDVGSRHWSGKGHSVADANLNVQETFMMATADRPNETASANIPVVHVAGGDELAFGTSAGTYEDARGNVQLSYKVREVVNQSAHDWYDVVAKAVKYVHGTDVASPCKLDGTVKAAVNSATASDVPTVPVPKSCAKAMSGEHSLYKYATAAEVNGLMETDTFELVELRTPAWQRRIIASGGILPAHFVYTAKYDTDGKLVKPKARIVAGGNFEPAPDNVFENFSPTAGPSLNRLMDAYCVYRGFTIWSTDCAQAFLNAKTGDRDIFVGIPPGMFDEQVRRKYCMRLKKYLYGLVKSPQMWQETLSAELKAMGFVAFDDDPCLLRLTREGPGGRVSEMVAEVFVDDIKWGFNDKNLAKEVICKLGDKFKTTVGDQVATSATKDTLEWEQANIGDYLGMKYSQQFDDEGHTTLSVDQSAYITKVVERFELQDCKKYKAKQTPLPGGSNTNRVKQGLGDYENDEELKEWAEKYSYPMIMGSLIHAMVHTRPDIAYAVSLLSRATAKPELWHYKAAQHLILYLRETRDLGIVYDQKKMWAHEARVTAATEHKFDPYFEASTDASFADDEETHRSTSGFVVWFAGAPIEWECKRQPLVTLSTMESEYVAASRCVLAIRFLHKFLRFVDFPRDHPTRVLEDNAACIAITDKPVHRQRSKHIGVKFMNVREASLAGEVKLVAVATEHQVADLFTKSLAKGPFLRLRDTLMGTVPFTDMVRQHQETVKAEKATVKYVTNINPGQWPTYTIPPAPETFLSAILGTDEIKEWEDP